MLNDIAVIVQQQGRAKVPALTGLQVGLSVDLLHLEFVQRNNFGMCPISGRQYHSRLLLVVGLNCYPGGMLSIHTPAIGVGQVM